MMDRARILLAMTRLPVILLLGLFTMTGLAHAGGGNDGVLLTKALVVVIAYLLFSVVVNDLADEAIDRVNLPQDPGRPLVTGASNRRQLVGVAVVAAAVAVIASALLHGPAVVVTAAGLLLSAGYSIRPVRLADRGAVASMLLPAGYVVVPYLLGILAVRPTFHVGDLTLMAGLYIGFIGRIVLKDFRDVRGDALFGKRTFLVRHGRRATCVLSAACWAAGAAALSGVRGVTPGLALAYGGSVLVALLLLRALAADGGARRDEALISALAILGRSTIVGVVSHLAMLDAGWSVLRSTVAVAGLTILFLAQALLMARHGPRSRLRLPSWDASASYVTRKHPSYVGR